ncbi:hypothetical protein BBI09_16160 [Stutzerimonas xanthomarina]|nr:hypothetical protein BBI09_16160 [Stutzerimonas xanthomarina]
MATMLIPTIAGAAPPDFSKWANKELDKNGVTDARVVETRYPFSFTYCRKDSMTLWRYDVMSAEHLEAIREGRIAKPLTVAQRTVAVENGSSACKVGS